MFTSLRRLFLFHSGVLPRLATLDTRCDKFRLRDYLKLIVAQYLHVILLIHVSTMHTYIYEETRAYLAERCTIPKTPFELRHQIPSEM